MFTQTSEYALRAIVCLAYADPESRTRTQLVEQTKVPAAYLAKVLKHLERTGLVIARRGQQGGFRLARTPSEITILEVVNAVDPIQRIKTCPLGIASHGSKLCPLHRKLDDGLAQVEQAFGETTLQDLLDTPSESIPLCDSRPNIVPLQLG